MTKRTTEKERHCRFCFCTDRCSCPTDAGPCCWIGPDICSAPRCILKRWTRTQRNWLHKAAAGRVTVRRCCAPPHENFAPRFLPRVAGKNVVLPDMPMFGYLTSEAATAAGERYKRECSAEAQRLAVAKEALNMRVLHAR